MEWFANLINPFANEHRMCLVQMFKVRKCFIFKKNISPFWISWTGLPLVQTFQQLGNCKLMISWEHLLMRQMTAVWLNCIMLGKLLCVYVSYIGRVTMSFMSVNRKIILQKQFQESQDFCFERKLGGWHDDLQLP